MGYSMRHLPIILVAVTLLTSPVPAAQTRSYTYVSPIIERLHGYSIQWRIEDGWRLTTNAEGPTFRATSLSLRFQRSIASRHRTEVVDGVLGFLPGRALRGRPELHRLLLTDRVFVTTPKSKGNLEVIYKLNGEDFVWAKILRPPPAQLEFWKREMQQVRWVPAKVKRKKL